MRDKSIRQINSSSDNSVSRGHDRRTRRAPGGSALVHEENLIDLSNDMNRSTMDSMQDDVECSSPDHRPASQERSSFVSTPSACHRSSVRSLTLRTSTKAAQVIGLFPFGRGSSQRPHVTNTDQQVSPSSKLEEDFVTLQKTCATLKKDGRDAAIENNQLRSKLKNAEEQLEKTEKLGRKKSQDHQVDIKSAKARNAMLRGDLETAENTIVRLQAEIDAADEKFQTSEIAAAGEISRLTSDVDIANEELFEEKSAARKEIARLQSQIKLLNEKNDKFRQMLVPVSEKQVPDAEVVRKFTALRSHIMGFVRRTWSLKFRNDVDVGAFSEAQHIVFVSCGLGSYDRLRYLVFIFIYHRIFDSKNYFLKDGFESLEEHLQKGEKSLIKKSSEGKYKSLS